MPKFFASKDVEYAALSVSGLVRRVNEDALLCRPDLGLWAVADGMGGHQRGDVASALAVDSLAQALEQGAGLQAGVVQANQCLLAQVNDDPSLAGMGTTLVAVRVLAKHVELAWVGDSRAYRIGRSGIEQLSHDHSWVQRMVDAGELSPEQAREHPQRNVILQCLGRAQSELEVASERFVLAPGELLLLCSDGLTGELDDQQILQRCVQAGTLTSLVENLIEHANEQGGRDNISCIVLARRSEQTGPYAPKQKSKRISALARLFKRLVSKR